MTSATINKKAPSFLSLFSSLKEDKLFKSLTRIFNPAKAKKPPQKHVEICVVNDSIYHGSVREVYKKDTVTVIYDRDNLDSLFGLAFFEYLYDGCVQAVAYQQCADTMAVIKPSKETIILGVDIACEDLVHLNSLTQAVHIFGYRGTFNYLYEPKTQKLFNQVKLFQADNDFLIGGRGVEKLENSVAMMLKILYFKSDDWTSWLLNRYAVMVAHSACFYENIPVYNLTKSTVNISHDNGNVKACIHNGVDILMHDFRGKLEDCLDKKNAKMFFVHPQARKDEYFVYRKRLQVHIDRTRKMQGWIGKGFFDAEKQYAYCIPAIGFAVHDLMALSSINVDTTVCMEDMGDKMVYYIYSKTEGKARAVARVLLGEKTWMKGHLVCTSKLKNPHERR